MEEDFPPSTGNDHHRLSFWRLAVSKCRHWLAVFLGPNTRSSAALNLLFSVESASYSVIHPSNSRSLWMSVVSAVYLVLAFYFVCVSNATSDRLNWNSHLTESRRVILPDPVMESMQSTLHKILGHDVSNSGNTRLPTLNGTEHASVSASLHRPPLSPLVPELFIVLAIAAFALRLLLFWSSTRVIAVLRRLFYVMGTVYLIRSLTVVATVLPFSYTTCTLETDEHGNPFIQAFELMLYQKKTCGDVFFSGHTIIYCMGYFSWITYYYSTQFSAFATIQFILALLSLLGSSYHYTIDILMSVVVCGIIWYLYHLAIRIFFFHQTHLASVPQIDRVASSSTQSTSAKSQINDEQVDSQKTQDQMIVIPIENVNHRSENSSSVGLLTRCFGTWITFVAFLDGEMVHLLRRQS